MQHEGQKRGRDHGARQNVRRRIEARLGVLRGFPRLETDPSAEDGIGWQLLPVAGAARRDLSIRVTADDVARCGVALRGLEIKFPRAYPAVVGDPAAFGARVAMRVEALQQALHRGRLDDLADRLLAVSGLRGPEQRQVLALRDDPDRADWLDALVWPLQDPDRLRRALATVETLGPQLGRLLALDRTVALHVFAWCNADGPELVGPVLELLLDPDFDRPLRDRDAPFDLGTPEPDDDAPGRRLAHWRSLVAAGTRNPHTPWLALLADATALPAAGRRDFAQLLLLLAPRELLAHTARILPRIDRLARHAAARGSLPAKALKKALQRIAGWLPEAPLEACARQLGRLAGEADPRRIRDLSRLAAALPAWQGHTAWRLAVITDLLENPQPTAREEEKVVVAHARATVGDPAATLAPWAEGDWWRHRSTVWHNATQDAASHGVERAFESYRRALQRGLPTPDRGWPADKALFWSALLFRPDPEPLASLTPALRSLGPSTRIYDLDLVTALNMAGGDGERAGALLMRYASWQQADWLYTTNPLQPAAGQAILDGDRRWIARAGAVLDELDQRGRSWERALLQTTRNAAKLAEPPSRTLPDGLRDRVPPSAHAVAERVLGLADGRGILERELERIRRPDAAVETERAALRRRIAELPEGPRRRGMEQRLTTLGQRQRGPLPPAQVRQLARRLEARCRADLRRRQLEELERADLEQRRGRTDAERHDRLERLAAERPELRSLVDGALGLEQPWRDLAIDLLLAPERIAPFGLLEHPRNQAFLDTARGHGLDLTRWLAAEPPRPLSDSRPGLTIELASDPLDVLRMGAWFGTCLSPGSFQFCSAVANALDADKRVLLVRGATGEVVGRCLLALRAEDCRLLTFRVYGRDGERGFEVEVAAFVEQLAGDLRSGIAVRGKVEPRVGPEWYDDSAVDLTGRMAWAAHDAPLWDELATTEAGQVEAVLRRHGGPLEQLEAADWEFLLSAKTFERHPGLAAPLMPWMVALCPPGTLVRIAYLADRAGDHDAARAALRRVRTSVGGFAEYTTALWRNLAVRLDPAAALPFLRTRRPRRRDGERRRIDWLIEVGDCEHALGRTRRAADRWDAASRLVQASTDQLVRDSLGPKLALRLTGARSESP